MEQSGFDPTAGAIMAQAMIFHSQRDLALAAT